MAKVKNCQKWKSPKLKVAYFKNCQNWNLVKLLKLKIAKTESFQNSKLPEANFVSCQNCKLLSKLLICELAILEQSPFVLFLGALVRKKYLN